MILQIGRRGHAQNFTEHSQQFGHRRQYHFFFRCLLEHQSGYARLPREHHSFAHQPAVPSEGVVPNGHVAAGVRKYYFSELATIKGTLLNLRDIWWQKNAFQPTAIEATCRDVFPSASGAAARPLPHCFRKRHCENIPPPGTATLQWSLAPRRTRQS